MIRRLLPAACAILMGAGLALPAHAAVDLKGDVAVVRHVTENGAARVTYSDPEQVLPGDRLVFTTTYTNTGSDAAENFVVTNPLPAPVRLSEAGDFTVSVDGGETFGPLASLTVAVEGGSSRPALLDDVTHIRWTLARVAPGATGNVKYFAEVR